jgi:hypothetical protein
MTVTGLHEVTCPTCFQKADLLFRPGTQDYILLEHYTHTHIKCATSNEVYPKELAKRLFGK